MTKNVRVETFRIGKFYPLKGRSNLPPDKVPWDALKTLLSQCIYGGRIDNSFDQVRFFAWICFKMIVESFLYGIFFEQTLLDCFIEKLFTVKSFDPDRVLIANIDGEGKNLVVPDGLRREQFVQWVDSVHQLQSPSWLGLPNNAEKVLLTTRGKEIRLILDVFKAIFFVDFDSERSFL